MKKILLVILMVFIAATHSFAQPGSGIARIHAAKIAYITDRVHLSRSQSPIFLPLYNDYEQEVKEIRRSFFKKYSGMNPDNADDATSRKYVDDNLDYQQQIIDLKRKYNERFLKIISPQQLSEMYIAEHEFQQILMQRLKHRATGPGRFRRPRF
jgi:Skp family chaperone for outer membrane proteins